MISLEIEPHVFSAIAAKSRDLQCSLQAIGGTTDHLHLLMRLHPPVSIARVIGEMKGSSSHLVNCELRKPFRWQAGYSAFSVSAPDVPAVESYIRNQKEHHGRNHLQVWLEPGWDSGDQPPEEALRSTSPRL